MSWIKQAGTWESSLHKLSFSERAAAPKRVPYSKKQAGAKTCCHFSDGILALTRQLAPCPWGRPALALLHWAPNNELWPVQAGIPSIQGGGKTQVNKQVGTTKGRGGVKEHKNDAIILLPKRSHSLPNLCITSNALVLRKTVIPYRESWALLRRAMGGGRQNSGEPWGWASHVTCSHMASLLMGGFSMRIFASGPVLVLENSTTEIVLHQLKWQPTLDKWGSALPIWSPKHPFSPWPNCNNDLPGDCSSEAGEETERLEWPLEYEGRCPQHRVASL